MSPGLTDVLGWKSWVPAGCPDLPFRAVLSLGRGQAVKRGLIPLMWELGQQEQPRSIHPLGWWLPKFWGVLAAPQTVQWWCPLLRAG